ncbi:MAG TPA: KEOPS complex subunit Cgi121 [Nitrososphaera sp.]|jgi:tRNA threonylcarbamoyladenosine modification (KEOPS) complex Cgi121 subunit/molybdopterin converting factor small subunit
MITIRLLGGAKKAVGKTNVNLERANASISDILDYLGTLSSNPRLLQPSNLIVTLNGIDSALLHGHSTMAKSGDTVTVVTVVHGGTESMVNGYYLSIIGVQRIVQDPGKLVDLLRARHKNSSVQAVNAKVVYGIEHVRGVIKIVLEAEMRNIMLTNRRETELLIRLSGTKQIAEAIRKAGLKEQEPGCIIAFSLDRESIEHFDSQIKNDFVLNESVLRPTEEKKDLITSNPGFAKGLDDSEILPYLLERAAVLVK